MFVGFKVTVNYYEDNRVSNDDANDDERCDGEIDKHCGIDDDEMCIKNHCRVGVVPRMAPPPSEGGST